MVTCWKDGQEWRIGTSAEVEWINKSTSGGLTITSAIPPVFEAYATIVAPAVPSDVFVIQALLGERAGDQPWWLGYLDTGDADVIFTDAPMVTLYADWHYVLVQAGKDEAERWRRPKGWRWSHSLGPDLIFPVDHSWLLSWLWDDDWLCFGGPAAIVDAMVQDRRLEVRRVDLTEDATPPGHVAR